MFRLSENHEGSEFNIKIKEKSVLSFSEVSGDASPLHMNEEFASRSRYRQRVVHGMLPLMHLGDECEELRGVEFKRLSGKFHAPLFLGQEAVLNLKVSNAVLEGELVCLESERVLTTIVGEIAPCVEKSSSIGNELLFSSHLGNPDDPAFEECQSLSGELPLLNLGQITFEHWTERNRIHDQLSQVALLSTVIGMKVPGKMLFLHRLRLISHLKS